MEDAGDLAFGAFRPKEAKAAPEGSGGITLNSKESERQSAWNHVGQTYGRRPGRVGLERRSPGLWPGPVHALPHLGLGAHREEAEGCWGAQEGLSKNKPMAGNSFGPDPMTELRE